MKFADTGFFGSYLMYVGIIKKNLCFILNYKGLPAKYVILACFRMYSQFTPEVAVTNSIMYLFSLCGQHLELSLSAVHTHDVP